jgi:uncharacterized membrane protein YeaQ/YmgE (transglycosylase-associated protein family)
MIRGGTALCLPRWSPRTEFRHADRLGRHHRLCRRNHRALFLAPGPNNPAGFILTTLLGIAGAFVATLLGQTIGWYGPNQGAGLLGAVVGAIVVLFVWHRLVTNRTIPDPGRRWL